MLKTEVIVNHTDLYLLNNFNVHESSTTRSFLSQCKIYTIYIQFTHECYICVTVHIFLLLTSLSYLARTNLLLAHFPVFLCLSVCRSKARTLSRASNFFKASSGSFFCNSSNSFSCALSFSFLSILEIKCDDKLQHQTSIKVQCNIFKVAIFIYL